MSTSYRPKPSIRLNTPLKQPDGRPFVGAPSINVDDLLGSKTGSASKNESVKTKTETKLPPLRVPFLYGKLPQLDLPPKNSNGSSLYPPDVLENGAVFERRMYVDKEPENDWKKLPVLPEWDLPDLEKQERPRAETLNNRDLSSCAEEKIRYSVPDSVSEKENLQEEPPVLLPEPYGVLPSFPLPRPVTVSVPNTVTDIITDTVTDMIAVPVAEEPSPTCYSVHEASKDTAALLYTKGVTKSYYKKKLRIPVLKGVDFSVRKSEFVSLVGQSGSGKSTLLHLLGTLDNPEYGEIYFEGQRIDNLSSAKRDNLRNRDIGFIFQFYHLLPELTTLENVLSPLMIRCGFVNYLRHRRQYIERAKDLLNSVGLSHRLKHKPNELSGGEMQRAAIARALMSEPKILLADEPTGNLDSVSAKEIIALLQKFNRERGLTIVMVTHDNTIAEIADRIVRIADGVIVEHSYR